MWASLGPGAVHPSHYTFTVSDYHPFFYVSFTLKISYSFLLVLVVFKVIIPMQKFFSALV